MGAVILSNIIVYGLAGRRKRTVPGWFGWTYGVVMLAIGLTLLTESAFRIR